MTEAKAIATKLGKIDSDEQWVQQEIARLNRKSTVASNLTSQTMLKILIRATEGYLGRLDEMLREAAIASLSKGYKKVEKSVLEEIAREYS